MKRFVLSLIFVAACSYGDTLTFSFQAPEGGQDNLPANGKPYATGSLTLLTPGSTVGGDTCANNGDGDCILVSVTASTVNGTYLFDNQGGAEGPGLPGNIFVFNDVVGGVKDVAVNISGCSAGLDCSVNGTGSTTNQFDHLTDYDFGVGVAPKSLTVNQNTDAASNNLSGTIYFLVQSADSHNPFTTVMNLESINNGFGSQDGTKPFAFGVHLCEQGDTPGVCAVATTGQTGYNASPDQATGAGIVHDYVGGVVPEPGFYILFTMFMAGIILTTRFTRKQSSMM